MPRALPVPGHIVLLLAGLGTWAAACTSEHVAPRAGELTAHARLGQQPVWTAVGGGAGHALGFADFDGDRLNDVAVARRSGEGTVRIDFAAGAIDFTQTLRPVSGDQFGVGLATGDFDGDRLHDLAVAQSNAPGAALHVFLGSGAGLEEEDRLYYVDLADFDATSGVKIAAVGDLNADGFDELVLGEPAASRIHIYVGTDLGPVYAVSETREGAFGTSVAGIGDADGDGYGDMVIGAPDALGGAGRLHLIHGAPLLVGVEKHLDGDPGDRLGSTVAALGRSERFEPVRFAAAHEGDGAGAVTVYEHDEAGFAPLVSLEPTGTATGFGTAIISLDHNRDGFTDIAVGAPHKRPGVVDLFMGTPDGPSSEALWSYVPLSGGSQFGQTLAAAPSADVGDALLIGDPTADRVALYESITDADHDGLPDAIEWPVGLSPLLVDTDGDGLTDWREWGTEDTPADTDGDGVINALDRDSDDDTIDDAIDNCAVHPNTDQADEDGNLVGDVCDLEHACETLHPDLEHVVVDDIGMSTGFDDRFFGHSNRGRALLAADFNLDGRVDFFQGNPGDESFVMVAVDDGFGGVRYELNQLLLDDAQSWAAATADYDNDGDYDIFVSNGGNECTALDNLFRNNFIETGTLSWTDVTDEAGIAGPLLHDATEPVPQASGNGTWGDYDQDGDVDLFVSANSSVQCAGGVPPYAARNVLWRNDGDGTFTDVTVEAGILSAYPTRNSTWVDIDNDSDLDLYESTLRAPNILWKNALAETGVATFTNATTALSGASDLSEPYATFASCAGDFDNDGHLDLMTFHHGGDDCSDIPSWSGGTQEHRLFLNRSGTSFDDVGDAWGLNDHPISALVGVMGSQVGDLNGDGWLDLWFGNGGPTRGEANQLFIWSPTEGVMMNGSALVDFAAPSALGAGDPPYPYRTHGSAFVDVDNDGKLELAVSNGGPDFMPDFVREPNRLLTFDWGAPIRWLKVRPVGNGVDVSTDAISTRIAVTVTGPSGTRTIHRHLAGSSCFSAYQGFEVYFGLDDATEVDRIDVIWPDGSSKVVTADLAINSTVVVDY